MKRKRVTHGMTDKSSLTDKSGITTFSWSTCVTPWGMSTAIAGVVVYVVDPVGVVYEDVDGGEEEEEGRG